MRQVRQQAEVWLASLDYETEVQRRDEYQQGRRERASEPMPGLDASPAERAAYFVARRLLEPPMFTCSGGRVVGRDHGASLSASRSARPRPVHRGPPLRR
jgi:hypothetical protein